MSIANRPMDNVNFKNAALNSISHESKMLIVCRRKLILHSLDHSIIVFSKKSDLALARHHRV